MDKESDKIQALRLKTVANGATIHEAESARALLKKLLAGSDTSIDEPEAKNKEVKPVEPGVSQGELFKKYWPKGVTSMTPQSIQEFGKFVDWDVLAQKNLKVMYGDYLRDTAVPWETYNRVKAGLRIKDANSEGIATTLSEYNTKCAYVFRLLYLKEKGLL